MKQKTINSILNKLNGYVTIAERESDDLIDIDYDNVISLEELEDFYKQSFLFSLNYCYLLEPPKKVIVMDDEEIEVVEQGFELGVILWCAGLIWRKYDVRSTDQVEDSGFVTSYGDQLIIDAKKQLQPYCRTIFSIW